MKWAAVILVIVTACAFAVLTWYGTSGGKQKGNSGGQASKEESPSRAIPNPRAEGHSGPPEAYPDPTRTPGATNPDINQEIIGETICNPGWSTKSIRPPASYTGRLKRQQIEGWNLPDTDTRDYEEDHFIPLELGGHPSDPRNLWPEPYGPAIGAHEKDKVENRLHKEVCNGDITLERAQKIIVEDWYACYVHLENRQACQ